MGGILIIDNDWFIISQAMEKAQQECSFLQDFIAHSLVPIALEQVRLSVHFNSQVYVEVVAIV